MLFSLSNFFFSVLKLNRPKILNFILEFMLGTVFKAHLVVGCLKWKRDKYWQPKKSFRRVYLYWFSFFLVVFVFNDIWTVSDILRNWIDLRKYKIICYTTSIMTYVNYEHNMQAYYAHSLQSMRKISIYSDKHVFIRNQS